MSDHVPATERLSGVVEESEVKSSVEFDTYVRCEPRRISDGHLVFQAENVFKGFQERILHWNS